MLYDPNWADTIAAKQRVGPSKGPTYDSHSSPEGACLVCKRPPPYPRPSISPVPHRSGGCARILSTEAALGAGA